MKKYCGRYPTTQEGLKSLSTQPGTLQCRDYKKVRDFKGPLSPSPGDTWGCSQSKDLRYESNVSGYRIEASYGFYVTDNSPEQADNRHWERHKSK